MKQERIWTTSSQFSLTLIQISPDRENIQKAPENISISTCDVQDKDLKMMISEGPFPQLYTTAYSNLKLVALKATAVAMNPLE